MRGRDLQLVAFTAHGLDQDGQVHLTTAHDAEGIGGGRILHLPGQRPSAALSAGGHGSGAFLVTYLPSRPARGLSLTEKVISTVGVVDLHEGQRLNLKGAHSVLPMVTGQTGECNDIACGDVVAGLAAIGLEIVQQLRRAAAHLQVGVVPVAHDHFLADLGNAVLDAANADAANELVAPVNRETSIWKRAHRDRPEEAG